jgi:hypothetical protein
MLYSPREPVDHDTDIYHLHNHVSSSNSSAAREVSTTLTCEVIVQLLTTHNKHQFHDSQSSSHHTIQTLHENHSMRRFNHYDRRIERPHTGRHRFRVPGIVKRNTRVGYMYHGTGTVRVPGTGPVAALAAWSVCERLIHMSDVRGSRSAGGRGQSEAAASTYLYDPVASIEGVRTPPMLPLGFRASRTRGGEACMHTRSARRFDGAAVERGATAGARTAVLLAVVVTLACGSVSPQRPLRLQGAPTPPTISGYSHAPQWRQLSEAPATQHRDSVDCRRLRHRQCCTAQGARIGAAGITPEYARPGRVNGVANLPCAQALHQLLYGLHCTADGAYWSTNSTNGSLTVCTDLCQRIEDTCGDVTGFTPTDVRRHGGQGSMSALNSSSYCLNLAARVGGSWGGGWVEVATCSGLGGDFESCGSAASSAAAAVALACVPRRTCARPCLGGSVQDMAEREAQVLSQGWAAHERGQCAAWMVENEQDPVHCGVFNIHAWQTHYTREGWARFRSRQACETHYKAYHCAACEGGSLGLRDVWEEWR